MIEVQELRFSYGGGCDILSGVSFSAAAGQCIAVLGNNGAGKSTLVKCLNRILQPQAGLVTVDGCDVGALGRGALAREMAYVAQKNEGTQLTVYDAVLLGRRPYIRFEPTGEDHRVTREVIARMGLTDFALRSIDELSGGELQKVMLARALAQQPKVLMLDEPTSALDIKNQYEVMALARELAHTERICVLIVIHDLNLALRYCDRFLFLKDCGVYSLGGPETVSRQAIRDVYGMDVAIENVRGYRTVVPLCG